MFDLKLGLQQCCSICSANLHSKIESDEDDEDPTALGSHPIGGKPLQKALCARRWRWEQCSHFAGCPEAASIPCEKCKLVKYCSLQCMQEHQESHRQLCDSHLLRKETTPFLRKTDPNLLPDTPITKFAHLPTLSNPSIPVYGLLGTADDYYKRLLPRYSSDEDIRYSWPSPGYSSTHELPDHLRFLFPCAYDLRNVLQTFCEVPDDYRGRVTIFINSAKSILAVRDVLILELLRCYGPDGIDIAIALWYSTALTPQQDSAMLVAIRRILYGSQSQNTEEDSERAITCRYQNSFPFSRIGSFLRADFSSDPRGILVGMLTDFNATFEPRSQYWERSEEMDDIENVKRMCALPAHLASWNRYHTCGLLLPFDAMDAQFTAPNRLRYCRSLKFITRYSNDVLCGWDILQVISTGVKYGASDQDLYGCLFFHIREMMQNFLQKLKNCCIELCLTQFTPEKLAETLHQAEISFHRVDAFSLARGSTIDSNYGSQDILSLLGHEICMSLPEVRVLSEKLSLLENKDFQSNPRQWALSETLQILGRLLEKDASKGFQTLLLTAMLDWTSELPSALDFLQEGESQIKSEQEYLRRQYDNVHQKLLGKWVYSAKLTPNYNEEIERLLRPYAKPARALLNMLEINILHNKIFMPYGNGLAAREVEKSGLEIMHSHRILPRNVIGLMFWRGFLEHGKVRALDDADLSLNEILMREYTRQLYYTVLFGGNTFLEEFQEWAWFTA